MKRTFQIGTLAAIVALASLHAFADEVAVLRNGFSIRHERRAVIGTITRLYLDGDKASFVDVPTDQIDHFESLPPEPTQAVDNKKTDTTTAPPQALQKLDQLDMDTLVNTASEIYKLDPDLVTSVIRAESGFNVRAVSPKGAQGLMQLMPQTATQLGVQNSFDARANVEGGTRYLRELLERYDFDLIKALAAYNAGPERVERYNGVPPYYETRAYIARIVRDFNRKKLAEKNASPAVTNLKKNSAAKAAPKSTAKSSAKTTASKSATATPKSNASVTASR